MGSNRFLTIPLYRAAFAAALVVLAIAAGCAPDAQPAPEGQGHRIPDFTVGVSNENNVRRVTVQGVTVNFVENDDVLVYIDGDEYKVSGASDIGLPNLWEMSGPTVGAAHDSIERVEAVRADKRADCIRAPGSSQETASLVSIFMCNWQNP